MGALEGVLRTSDAIDLVTSVGASCVEAHAFGSSVATQFFRNTFARTATKLIGRAKR